MKSTYYIISLLLIFTVFSCSEDFLELAPESELSSGNFWSIQADAEAGVIGCYDALQPDAYFGFDYYVFGDVRSDNCFAGGDNPNNFGIDNFNIRPTNQIVTRFWNQVYVAIGRTNIAIDRITEMEDALFETGRKEALLGEAHFLRGLHYFYLVQLYGGVPIVVNETVSLEAADIKVPRDTENQVYGQVISDLETAINLLEGKDQDTGRATVGAAESLLAKVQLTVGNYNEVILLTDSVLTRGYTLLSNYDALFNQENKNNNEVIFAVQYNGAAEGNVFPELVLPTPEASFDFIKFNTPTPNSQQQFEIGDQREPSSLVERNGTRYLFKWRNGSAFNSADHNVILRYADLLLIRAEALNLTGNTDEAISILNQIRNRAGLGDYSGEVSQPAVDSAILNERRVELMFEGHRWFDLKRKGFDVAKNAISNAKGIDISSSELVLPIPQLEIDRNELLEQNPGY
ncbi:RagB/SusD family nutrient uptake outer membrane protein [Aquimarina sp. M1]